MKTRNVLTVVAAAAFAVFAQAGYAQVTKEERKAEAAAATKSGQIPGGEAAGMKAERAEKSKASTTTKAERKSEAAAANKAGQLAPAGENPTPKQ
jgi:hypothetical protein